MQQENALIGVQIAAYYPDISCRRWASTPATRWASCSAQQPVLVPWRYGDRNPVQRRPALGDVAAARATYDASVASYRQTVLTAFQQVEDALSDLRILQQQAKAEAIAVNSTQRAVDATLNAYRAGTVAYTSVITEQTLLLSDQQTALSVRQSRLVASVALIEALGGGWSTADLPKKIKTPNPLVP